MLDKNDDGWLLLELFFKRPSYGFHLRELCRILGWSPTKVRSLLDDLGKEGIIAETREKHMSMFRSNLESPKFRKFKIVHNVLKAFEMAEVIENNLEDFEAIILFGSARKGEDTENSDFDLCIIGAKPEKDAEFPFSEMEKSLGRKVSLLFVDSVEKLRDGNKELLNNLINGFVIKGYLRVLSQEVKI